MSLWTVGGSGEPVVRTSSMVLGFTYVTIVVKIVLLIPRSVYVEYVLLY